MSLLYINKFQVGGQGKFNTKLKSEMLESYNKHTELFPGLKNDKYDYDTQGFYKDLYKNYNGDFEAITRALTPGNETEHIGTDRYKKPNHPTFSNESKYHIPLFRQAGKWGHDDKGDYFKAKKRNIKNMVESDGSPLNYFKRAEDYDLDGKPDVRLIYKKKEMFQKGGSLNDLKGDINTEKYLSPNLSLMQGLGLIK